MRRFSAVLALAWMLGVVGTAKAEAPKNVVPPSISGSAVVGQVLTANTGTWEPTPTKYTYSWERCNASAAECGYLGVNTPSYTLVSADLGHTIKVLVAAWNSLNQFAWLAAGPTSVVEPAMQVSLDSGGWWVFNDTAMNAGKLKLVRYQNAPTETLAKYSEHGYKLIDLIGHNPATGQVPETVAAEAVSRAKAFPAIVATEVDNEPQNPFLGGSESQANWEAYARVFNAVADKFVVEGVKSVPLWSADGGFAGVSSWGAHVWPLLDANAKRIGRPTEHPYGGTGERAKSALGNRARLEEAFALTGLKSWVTEVGWPTCVGCEPTGDSLQWTEAEQAANIESFVRWAPAFAEDVTVFQYRDYGTNDFYGIETHEGVHKASFATLESLAP